MTAKATIEALRTTAEQRLLFFTAQYLEKLLQLAGIAGTKPENAFSITDRKEAIKFWCLVFGVDYTESSKAVFDAARAYHIVMWTASQDPRNFPYPEIMQQAGEYCIHLVEACNYHLNSGAPLLTPPQKITRPALRLIGGYAVEKILDL